MAFEFDDIKKSAAGSKKMTGALLFETGAPLDDRSAVNHRAGLLCADTFAKKTYMYNGLVTTDASTGYAYILYNLEGLTLLPMNTINERYWSKDGSLRESELDAEISKYWRKLASDSDLQDIKNVVSGIFQFKGVASAIDPDHTTLTIGKGTVSGDIGTPEKPNTINGDLVSYGTVLSENLGSMMYAWGTPEYRSLFYTDGPDPTLKLFYRGKNLSTAYYIKVYDTLYFDTGRTEEVHYTTGEGENITTNTRIYKVWEAINKGGTLYSVRGSTNKTVNIYATLSYEATPNPLISEVTVLDYTYWEFNEYEENKFTVNIDSTITTVTASSENNGHVYQLGEEEYASNGNMWVLLGSPKTDWIVL